MKRTRSGFMVLEMCKEVDVGAMMNDSVSVEKVSMSRKSIVNGFDSSFR